MVSGLHPRVASLKNLRPFSRLQAQKQLLRTQQESYQGRVVAPVHKDHCSPLSPKSRWEPSVAGPWPSPTAKCCLEGYWSVAPPMVLAKSAAPVAAIAGLRAGREEGRGKGHRFNTQT